MFVDPFSVWTSSFPTLNFTDEIQGPGRITTPVRSEQSCRSYPPVEVTRRGSSGQVDIEPIAKPPNLAIIEHVIVSRTLGVPHTSQSRICVIDSHQSQIPQMMDADRLQAWNRGRATRMSRSGAMSTSTPRDRKTGIAMTEAW